MLIERSGLMFDSSKKHYVLQRSNGRMLHLYYKENTGIILRTPNRRSWYTNPVISAKNAGIEFAACLDNTDVVHIIYPNSSGSLYHGIQQGGRWETTVLPPPPQSGTLAAAPFALPHAHGIHIFFSLDTPVGRNLYYQSADTVEGHGKPILLGHPSSTVIPVLSAQNEKNDLYIFYNAQEKQQRSAGYRRLRPSAGLWEEFSNLPEPLGGMDLVTAAADTSGIVHVCCQRAVNGKQELVYARKALSSTNRWENIKVLMSSDAKFHDISLLWTNHQLILYWVRENTVYYRASSNGGDTWSGEQVYSFPDREALYCLSYISNLPEDRTGRYLREIPGKISPGIKLSFAAPDSSTQRSLQSADTDMVRQAVTEVLTQINDSIRELKQFMINTGDKLEYLNTRQQQLESDMEKINKMSGSINLDLARVKSDFEEIQNSKAPVKVLPVSSQAPDPIPAQNNNTPLMPGSGFSSITPAYLQSLKKNKQSEG